MIFLHFFRLQGIPSCPLSLDLFRSHLPHFGCWNLSCEKQRTSVDDTQEQDTPAAVNNNNHIIVGDLGSSEAGGAQKDHFGPNFTPLHRFYKQQQQRRMPGFRGRRGLCGCFQVCSEYVAISHKRFE